MKSLFDFSALYYVSYVALSVFTLRCVADRVQTMHDLLSCSGWLGMASIYQQMEIIDRRRPDEPEIKLTVFNLLATPVTEENVTSKIQEAHQFLSCSYAKTLIDLCDYEQGIGPQCRRMATAPGSFDCLEDYLLVIEYKRPVVSRMTGALLSLQGLAPSQTHFENRVFEILGELERYYNRGPVQRPPGADETTKPIADAESEAIEGHSRLMSRGLFAFYNRYCWPVDYWIRSSGLSKPAEDIRRFAQYSFNTGVYITDSIKDEIRKIVNWFMGSHDYTSGFDYDPGTNTTRIMTFDPSTVERVGKMNRLLGDRGFWNTLKPLEIKVQGSPYRTTVDDLVRPNGRRIVVTKENLQAKLKRAHQFMSCQHAWILVECCHHVTDMWSNCKQSEDSVCLEHFVQILNEADPSVLSMVDGLMYFYNLSPDTAYNRDVFHLLNRFKNFYHNITARTDRGDVMGLSPEIENDVSEIAQNSITFFQQFCSSDFDIHSFYVSATEKHSTIDVKGEVFKNRMLRLTRYYDLFN